MAAVTLCWQISNALLLFTLFISVIGLITRIFRIYYHRLRKFDVAFILFYLASFMAIFLQWLVFNALLLFPESTTTYDNIALWFKGAIWFLTLASLFLIYIGQHSLVMQKLVGKKYYSHGVLIVYLFSLFLLILIILTDFSTTEIIDNSPSFDFNPEITLAFTGLYGLIIGGMYAFISLRSKIQLKEPFKELIPLYPLHFGFLLVGGGSLIAIGLIIIFDPFTVPIWPCLRMVMSSIIYIAFLWYPTLESMLEIFFHSRLRNIETLMERDKVLDIIDHDLANVTQILHTYFETTQLSDQDKVFLKKQVDRMSKLITESRAIVIHEDDALVKQLMEYYKSVRVIEDDSEE